MADATSVVIQVFVRKHDADYHVGVSIPTSEYISGSLSSRDYEHGTFMRGNFRISPAPDPETLDRLLLHTVFVWPLSKREALLRRSAEAFEDILSNLYEVFKRERDSDGDFYAMRNLVIQAVISFGQEILDLAINLVRMS
jgi:hypothetical protein